MSDYRITTVRGPREWTPQQSGNTFHSYDLVLDGVAKTVEINQKPETPAPTAGQTVDLDLSPHPRFEEKLKGKRVQRQFGGGGRQRDPKETAAIQRQHSQSVAVWLIQAKAAAGLATAEDFTPAKLRFLTDYFEDDIQGHALNRPAPQEGPPSATSQQAHGSGPLPPAAPPPTDFPRTGRSDIPEVA